MNVGRLKILRVSKEAYLALEHQYIIILSKNFPFLAYPTKFISCSHYMPSTGQTNLILLKTVHDVKEVEKFNNPRVKHA